MKNAKITIYTQVYNTEKYLRQCLDSVVNQTYPVHQYIVVDNGCTDGCSEIIKEYEEKYDFIEVVKHETNQRGFWQKIISEKATGDYLSIIDSDDWWEPDYLEKMVSFLEANNLDLAVTGTQAYYMETETSEIMRKLDEPLFLTQKEFADRYSQFWTFPSTNWACLFKTRIYKGIIDGAGVLNKVSTYGGDTANTLEYIKHCKKIGIDDTVLYHYRLYPQSVSYNYDENRFSSNIGYYECIKDFLKLNDSLDAEKQLWLKKVHLQSLFKTLRTLDSSKLSAIDKILETEKILLHPLTTEVLKVESDIKNELTLIVGNILSKTVSKASGTKYEKDVKEIFVSFFPECGHIFDFSYLLFFASEKTVWEALLLDKRNELLVLLSELLENGKYKNQYDLASLVLKLIPEDTLLSEIKNEEFFVLYADVVKLVLTSQNIMALNRMTEILFSGNELNCPEDFLNLYVTLAALENHVEAFLFGNIQKAYLFIDEKRLDEAKQIVNDLIEMGAGESEDVIEIIKTLEKW